MGEAAIVAGEHGDLPRGPGWYVLNALRAQWLAAPPGFGGADLSVEGWSVQYHSSSTTGAWQVTELHGSIPAGGLYLVAEAKGAGGTQALPTAQATGAIPMSATIVRHAPDPSFASSDGARSDKPRWNPATLSLEKA